MRTLLHCICTVHGSVSVWLLMLAVMLNTKHASARLLRDSNQSAVRRMFSLLVGLNGVAGRRRLFTAHSVFSKVTLKLFLCLSFKSPLCFLIDVQLLVKEKLDRQRQRQGQSRSVVVKMMFFHKQFLRPFLCVPYVCWQIMNWVTVRVFKSNLSQIINNQFWLVLI